MELRARAREFFRFYCIVLQAKDFDYLTVLLKFFFFFVCFIWSFSFDYILHIIVTSMAYYIVEILGTKIYI